MKPYCKVLPDILLSGQCSYCDNLPLWAQQVLNDLSNYLKQV